MEMRSRSRIRASVVSTLCKTSNLLDHPGQHQTLPGLVLTAIGSSEQDVGLIGATAQCYSTCLVQMTLQDRACFLVPDLQWQLWPVRLMCSEACKIPQAETLLQNQYFDHKEDTCVCQGSCMPSVFKRGDYVNLGKIYIHLSPMLGLAHQQSARSLVF